MVEKQLVRPQEGRVIAGVAAGLAHYFNVDVTLVRMAFVLAELLSAGMLGLIVYVVLWAITPEEQPQRADRTNSRFVYNETVSHIILILRQYLPEGVRNHGRKTA